MKKTELLALLALIGCQKGSVEEPQYPSEDVSADLAEVALWTPSAVELDLYMDALSADGDQVFGLDIRRVEEELAMDEITDRVHELAETGVDADYLVLPTAQALELEARGWVDVEVRLFSTGDPQVDALTSDLTLATLRPSPLGEGGGRSRIDGADIQDLRDAFKRAFGWDGVGAVIEDQLEDAAVEETLKLILKLFGQKVASRLVGHFYGVFDDLFTLGNFLKANIDLIDANVGAYRGSAGTVFEAAEGVANEIQDLSDIKIRFLDGEITADEAREEALEGWAQVLLYSKVAREAIEEIANAGYDAGLYNDIIDTAVADFEAKIRDCLKVYVSDEEQVLPPAESAAAVLDAGATQDAARADAWAALAAGLVGYDPENRFLHSNGELKTDSLGAFDIVGFGGAVLPEGIVIDNGRCNLGLEPTESGGFSGCVSGSEMAFPDEEWVVAAVLLDAPLPLAPEGSVQHGLVTNDGFSDNDYHASPAYPADLFDGTDTWWQLRYDGGWNMTATDGDTFAPKPTAARVVVYDEAILWFIPLWELGTWGDPSFQARATMFRHDGDYGMTDGVFDGDVTPVVGELLDMPTTELP